MLHIRVPTPGAQNAPATCDPGRTSLRTNKTYESACLRSLRWKTTGVLLATEHPLNAPVGTKPERERCVNEHSRQLQFQRPTPLRRQG